MVKLSNEMKEDFAKMKVFPFATASKGGEPNVVPIEICKLQEDGETIWIADNYSIRLGRTLKKTQGVQSTSGDPKSRAATR